MIALTATVGLLLPAAGAAAQETDPREGLGAGFQDAETAIWNMDHVAHLDKPTGFTDPSDPAAGAYRNSDMAFSQDHAFVGNYAGVQIYDIEEPTAPELRTGIICPGGQGDVSVNGDLLFVSVQQLGTVGCETLSEETADDEFRGVRIFDISDLDDPQQVAAVQTCRGSHTHTVVEDLDDPDHVYVYVQGTSRVRSDSPEGLTCVEGPDSVDPADFPLDSDTDRFQVEVIRVPVDAPEDAEIVNEARLFANDESVMGLEPNTDACHDITAYPEIGLAAGACEGNGLLIDISDPANPERIDFVADTTYFAYWHSATFSNDGSTVVFTDEKGGGGGAECVPETGENLGANAIYEIVETADGPRFEASPTYYKIPNVQTAQENCVAHNGSLVPVPGRDIMVQAWYQGGISVMDFTDPDAPEEIAFFDRGPLDEDEDLELIGFWSAYYYNGYVYGSEIGRGFDVFELTPSEYLSEADLEAAAAVRLRELTPQSQQMITDADRRACAGVEPVDFPDVTGGPHQDFIECIAGYGIALGWPDGTYRPGLDIDRDQMASFIKRMLEVAGVELPDAPADAFGDDDGNVHELAINQLVELGVIKGKTATTYAPDDAVTRAQMAALIVRSVEDVLGEDLPSPRSPFRDVPSGWVHTEAIDAAYAAGIVRGRTATTFEPQENVRRDQMGSFIGRSLELLHHELVALDPVD